MKKNKEPTKIQINNNELSFYLIPNKTLFENNRLKFPLKNLSSIGKIESFFERTESLNISKNNFSDLTGIDQFINLKSLDLSFNKISDIKSLSNLKQLSKLEAIFLEGNSLSQIPNYKSIILTLLPNLKYLDGKLITVSEKEICARKLKLQYDLLEKMLDNYVKIIFLQSLSHKINMHIELSNKSNGFYSERSPKIYENTLKYFNFYGTLSEKTKNELRSNLLQDVKVLQYKSHPRPELEDAFQDLYNRQNSKLQKFESDLKSILNMKEQKKPAFEEMLLNRKTIEQEDLFNIDNSINLNDKKQNKNNEGEKVKKCLIPNKDNNFNDKLNSSFEKSKQNFSDSKKTQNNNNSRNSFHSDIPQKNKLLEQLSFSLEQKMNEVLKLEKKNIELSNNLEINKSTYEKNKEKQDKTVESLQESIKKLMKENKLLEDQLNKQQSQNLKIIDDNQSIKRQIFDINEIQTKFKLLENKIKDQAEIEEKADLIYEFRNFSLKKFFFKNLEIATILSKKIDYHKSKFSYLSNKKNYNLVFQQWKNLISVKKIRNIKNNFKLKKIFVAIKKNLIQKQKIIQYKNKWKGLFYIKTWVNWKIFSNFTKKINKIKINFYESYEKRGKKNIFSIMKKNLKIQKEKKKLRDIILKRINKFHNARLLKKSFLSFKTFYHKILKSKTMVWSKINNFHIKSLKKKSISSLKRLIQLKKLRLEIAINHSRKKTLNKKYFCKIIFNYLKERQMIIYKLKKNSDSNKIKILYEIWKKKFVLSKKMMRTKTNIYKYFARNLFSQLKKKLKINDHYKYGFFKLYFIFHKIQIKIFKEIQYLNPIYDENIIDRKALNKIEAENTSLRAENAILQNEFTFQAKNSSKIVDTLYKEKEKLQNFSQQLQKELELSNKSIQEYEEIVFNKSKRTEDIVSNLEQTINIKISEINEKNIFLEKKENEIIELNQIINELEKEKEDFQKKVQRCLDNINQNNSINEHKIEDFKKDNDFLKKELEESRNSNQRYLREISQLKLDLRKYEMELNSKESNDQYINNKTPQKLENSLSFSYQLPLQEPKKISLNLEKFSSDKIEKFTRNITTEIKAERSILKNSDNLKHSKTISLENIDRRMQGLDSSLRQNLEKRLKALNEAIEDDINKASSRAKN